MIGKGKSISHGVAALEYDRISVFQGDASLLKDQEPFDVIIANINRNILLNDMKRYVSCMHPGS